MTVVNNQETHEGDSVFYVDDDKIIHEAVIKSIAEVGGNHHVSLEFKEDGKAFIAEDVPHNTSPEAHSWNHPRNKEEVEFHNHPDFYGSIA